MELYFKIPSGRSFLAAAVQNENLYVFGGNGDQNTRSNELYRFKVETTRNGKNIDFVAVTNRNMCVSATVLNRTATVLYRTATVPRIRYGTVRAAVR